MAVHDGPGIRTTVFLKGCNMNCLWCHNPEGIESFPELIFRESRCIFNKRCIEVCPKNAIIAAENKVYIDRALCNLCFECVNMCKSNALELCGENLTLKEIISEVMSDSEFYKQSGGGLTISGGEPLMQYEFLKNLLKEAKKENLHICLDTCGYFDSEKLKEIISNPSTSNEERQLAINSLNKISKNSSKVRLRNRCAITGRCRGYLRKFKISRLCFREMASSGLIPGITKASW